MTSVTSPVRPVSFISLWTSLRFWWHQPSPGCHLCTAVRLLVDVHNFSLLCSIFHQTILIGPFLGLKNIFSGGSLLLDKVRTPYNSLWRHEGSGFCSTVPPHYSPFLHPSLTRPQASAIPNVFEILPMQACPHRPSALQTHLSHCQERPHLTVVWPRSPFRLCLQCHLLWKFSSDPNLDCSPLLGARIILCSLYPILE